MQIIYAGRYLYRSYVPALLAYLDQHLPEDASIIRKRNRTIIRQLLDNKNLSSTQERLLGYLEDDIWNVLNKNAPENQYFGVSMEHVAKDPSEFVLGFFPKK